MRVAVLFGTIGLLVLPARADDLKSGVPVGSRPGPYSFLVATGPQRGQPTCYICEQAEKPACVVFARSLTPAVGKLLAKLDAEVVTRKDAGFKAWMTHLTPTADLNSLAKWAQEQGLKNVPVGAFEDADGPPAYTLAAKADVTVLVFANRKVLANVAVPAGGLTDADIGRVLAAIPAK